ncbi:MAG: class I tRNA ligase family protein, partial [Oscillospiraceae bacterium]|nr:class I tRNA ligase family protein [Oscillospiraceae bacterium]
GVDPADIFKRYGADMLRLWAASADYHADVRCGENIFKQLSQNYLKFRNTCKFMLDNLVDFDPESLVKPEDMPELDRWLLTKLNELIEKVAASYHDYEFHIITHAVNDFCVGVLSTFYLDIVKDRLYCDGKDSLSRRSAQTALYLTLDTLAKLFAPVLCFTCDEIWLAMPHRAGDDARNVLFNEMNKPFADYALPGDLTRWNTLQMLRNDVNGALEKARADKKIGKSLEAHVTLVKSADSQVDLEQTLSSFGEQLPDLMIVSDVELSDDAALYEQGEETQFAGWRVAVSEAKGEKCPRCWKHSTKANADGLCPRCAAVVAKLPDLA